MGRNIDNTAVKDGTEAPSLVQEAEIVREYGPFASGDRVHGVTYDGAHVWAATGEKLIAFNPENGKVMHTLECACDAGTAFDGAYLYQLAGNRIQKIDPATGAMLTSIPAPGNGCNSGLAWAEGSLWVGQYDDRKIHRVDPETGTILRTIESQRFVTGVTGLEYDGAGVFYCGGGSSGKVRAVRRPK